MRNATNRPRSKKRTVRGWIFAVGAFLLPGPLWFASTFFGVRQGPELAITIRARPLAEAQGPVEVDWPAAGQALDLRKTFTVDATTTYRGPGVGTKDFEWDARLGERAVALRATDCTLSEPDLVDANSPRLEATLRPDADAVPRLALHDERSIVLREIPLDDGDAFTFRFFARCETETRPEFVCLGKIDGVADKNLDARHSWLSWCLAALDHFRHTPLWIFALEAVVYLVLFISIMLASRAASRTLQRKWLGAMQTKGYARDVSRNLDRELSGRDRRLVKDVVSSSFFFDPRTLIELMQSPERRRQLYPELKGGPLADWGVLTRRGNGIIDIDLQRAEIMLAVIDPRYRASEVGARTPEVDMDANRESLSGHDAPP